MPGVDPYWLGQEPPGTVVLPDGARLTRPVGADVGPWVAAVNESLDHLSPWLAWAGAPLDETTMGSFLEQVDEHWEARDEFAYLIRPPDGDAVIGGCGLHARPEPGILEIGYWVHVEHTGRGIATGAAGALTDTALGLDDVASVMIRVDAANERSLGVPRRLGYRMESTERRVPQAPGESGELLVWRRDRC